jgi:hypothetical protein
MDGGIAVSSATLETPEDDQCWSNMYYACSSDVEKILKFKALKIF